MFFNALALYFVMLPFGVVDFAGLGSLLKIYGFVLMLIYAFSEPKVDFGGKISGAQLLLVLSMILSGLFGLNRDHVFSRTFSNVQLYAMLLICSSAEFSKEQIDQLHRSQAWGSRIMLVILLYYGTYSTKWHRLLLLDNTPVIEDPNYIIAYFTFGLAMAFYRLFYAPSARGKVLGAVEMAIYLVVTLLTGSRSGMICLIVTSLSFFMFSRLPGNGRGVKVGILILCTAIGTIVFSVLPAEYLTRFTVDAMTGDGGTGRTGIWENGLRVFSQAGIYEKLFGHGAGCILDVFQNNGIRVIVMHNMPLEILVEDGVVGLIFYLLVIWHCVRVSIKSGDMISLSVILGMLVFSLMASIYTFKPYWNAMMLCCCLEARLGIAKETEPEEEKDSEESAIGEAVGEL